MSDPNIGASVGLVTGVIGTCTGIAGALMGYVAFRRTGQMKRLDLRLELRKAVIDLHTTTQGLSGLLAKAKTSRTAVAIASGSFQSSWMKLFLDELAIDQASISALLAQLPESGADFQQLSNAELESELVDVHNLRGQANLFAEKYAARLSDDDGMRERIRADVSAAALRRQP